jgi:hypothetical protein
LITFPVEHEQTVASSGEHVGLRHSHERLSGSAILLSDPSPSFWRVTIFQPAIGIGYRRAVKHIDNVAAARRRRPVVRRLVRHVRVGQPRPMLGRLP